jgi:uroporphyrinogen-III synthase
MDNGPVVIVTRPEPGASRSMATLLNMGVNARSMPLTTIVPIDSGAVEGAFDGIVFTSQNAVRHGASIAAHSSYRAFCVGERTAASARARGFHVDAMAETAKSLLPLIAANAPNHVLYVTGRPRRPDIEEGLIRAAIRHRVLEVYCADPVIGAPERIALAARSARACHLDVILLLHSPAASELLLAHDGSLATQLTSVLCLSNAVADALGPAMRPLAMVAARPDDTSLLKALADLLVRLPVAGSPEGA